MLQKARAQKRHAFTLVHSGWGPSTYINSESRLVQLEEQHQAVGLHNSSGSGICVWILSTLSTMENKYKTPQHVRDTVMSAFDISLSPKMLWHVLIRNVPLVLKTRDPAQRRDKTTQRSRAQARDCQYGGGQEPQSRAEAPGPGEAERNFTHCIRSVRTLCKSRCCC